MKKIMFNDRYGLHDAVMNGTKTMTRRIIPQSVLDAVKDYQEKYYAATLSSISVEDAILNMVDPERMFNCAFRKGEIVAIAQRYKDAPNLIRKAVHYYGEECKAGWNNKMFVKAEYMPHHIKITGIHVEHLQDISDEDCLREGIMEGEFMNTWDRYYYDHWGDCPNHITFRTPRAAFASLIDRIGKRGTWESNPLVFVYEFERFD